MAAASTAAPAAAGAATYFVAPPPTGDDVGNCRISPCETIEYALDRHRDDPRPDDVIEVAAGGYAQSVAATDPADDGLTIRGGLDSSGDPATEISGDGPGIVALGNSAPGAAEVTLENVLVTQTDADLDVTPVFLDGGSDLDTVDVEVQDANTWAGVELCTDPGSTLTDVFIDSRGTDAAGIDGCAAVTITDSAVFTDGPPALIVGGDPTEITEITRSWLDADDDFAPALALTSGLVLDSSIASGGAAGLEYTGDPAGGASLDVNNSTIDADIPGVDDATSIAVERNGTDPTAVTIDSSILVDQIDVANGTQPTTLTCTYSNFQSTIVPLDPDFTDNCPDAGVPGSTNTAAGPDELFVDASNFDWRLRSGSPAIDAGQPGAVPAGFSPTDLQGDPRRVPGSAATCPAGIRDQGAFEAAAVSCVRTLAVSTAGTGSGTVTGPGIDCGGAGHTDCSETVPTGTQIALTATPAGGSRFAGFAGAGCSASPCTVTLDSSRAVAARFNDAGVQALRIELTGAGRGVVTGPGIDCGQSEGHGDCSETYATGEQVTLTATPEKASQFAAFAGAGCSASPCTLTMDAPHTVSAGFDPTAGPTTTFAKRPEKPWPSEPVFVLRSSAPNSTFECRVDRESWEECDARVKLRGLEPGKHKFRARATDPSGITGPRASDRFRIPA